MVCRSIEENNLEGLLKTMSTTGTLCLRFLQYLSVYLLVVLSLVSCASGYKDCSSQADCSYDDSCCAGQCVDGTDCIGNSCSDDNDCRSYEICCDGICSDNSCYTLDYGAVGGIVAGATIFICLFSLCCYFACYRPGGYRGRVIVQTRATTATVTTTCVTQSNTPYQYQGQVPPPHQQSYPYNPPPQYVQYSPYNAGSARSSEPPPPYSIAPEERPGGVYAPQRNYGAVPTPSAPHFKQ